MRRLNNEEGATAVLMAILLTLLIAFAAFVLDVGAMHSEVRQLQNVADAGAMAIAQDCAEGNCGNTTGTAALYAASNSNDALADTAVAVGTNSVTVTATTRDAAGGNDGASNTLTWALAHLPPLNQNELTLSRSATASWGAFGGGATIPIALCERNWDYFTGSGATLPSGTVISRFGAPNGNAAPVEYQDCSNPSGDTYPGGFGFLQRDSNCMAITLENAMYPGSTGNNAVDNTSSCNHTQLFAFMRALVDSGQPALIPIFDYFEGTGSNGQFHVIGYGAFVLQGFDIKGAGGQAARYGMANNECPSQFSCLKGIYTEFVSLEGAGSYSSGGGSFGGYFVGLTG